MSDLPVQTSFFLPAASLWRREVLHFLRARSRLIGAVATPLVFWIFVGSGLGDSFRMKDADASMGFLEYSFPGAILMVVLFTAVFSSISVIEDRRAGFLQAVLTAPVNRSAIAMGKVMGSTTLALAQALLFLLLAPVAGIPLTFPSLLMSLVVLAIASVGLSAMGLLAAWRIESVHGFHAIMNLVLMPMWLLSGALFPSSGASTWLTWVMAVNPLTYGMAALRHAMYFQSPGAEGLAPSFAVSVAVSAGFALIMMILAVRTIAAKN